MMFVLSLFFRFCLQSPCLDPSVMNCYLKRTLFSLSCFRSCVHHSDRNWIRTGTVLISTVALVKYPDKGNLEDKESISDPRSKSQWQEFKWVGHIAFMGQRDMNACMLAWLVFCLVLNLGPKPRHGHKLSNRGSPSLRLPSRWFQIVCQYRVYIQLSEIMWLLSQGEIKMMGLLCVVGYFQKIQTNF